MVFQRSEVEGREVASAEVVSGERRQRLSVVQREEPVLVLSESGARLRSWPLQAVRLAADLPDNKISVEAGGETLTWTCPDENTRRELSKCAAALVLENSEPLADAALSALLEHAAADDSDAELWVKRLAERLAKLDALNVGGMLAAATEGGGATLSERLEAGVQTCTALSNRLSRYESITRAAAGATTARSGAAKTDANARALLRELKEIYEWLDAPAIADLDALPQISLASPEGRAAALSACEALRTALRAENTMPAARRKLAAVRERIRKLQRARDQVRHLHRARDQVQQLQRARDQLSAALARHLNNALIHVGNEVGGERQRHHAQLLPLAPFMKQLRLQDDKAYTALQRVYVSTWARTYERDVRAVCDAAKARLSAGHAADQAIQQVLDLVEDLCNREQDFCTQFFHLDLDVKSEGSDGDRSSKSGSERGDSGRRASDTKRLMGELLPALEGELLALVAAVEKHDPYGAMRVLACVGRRVLAPAEGQPANQPAGSPSQSPSQPPSQLALQPDSRCARSALAAVAVAAKRGADKIVADRIAGFTDHIKQAAKRPKCGVLGFIPELESLSRECEAIFAGSSRRADLERWYLAVVTAMLRAIANAEHPRTPRALVHTENYHALHGVLSTLRVPALESVRRECKSRYSDALHQYVTRQLGRPLERLTQFFEGVAEAVSGGVREEEICYRASFSKHELRRVLALYPAHEVRKSLHRLYRTVEKQLSEEGGLLQVVWRAMQEEFIAQHTALQTRMTACYPGSGLAMPLSTNDILEAFSDIAREH